MRTSWTLPPRPLISIHFSVVWNLLWHSLHRGDPLYLSHPLLPTKNNPVFISLLDETQIHVSHNPLFHQKRQQKNMVSGIQEGLLPSRNGYCTPQVYGIGNLESMIRSFLVWLDSDCKVLYQHLSQGTDSSIFPRRLALIGSSFLLSGSSFKLENLISSLSIQWSRVTHLYTNVMQILSFFQMTDL